VSPQVETLSNQLHFAVRPGHHSSWRLTHLTATWRVEILTLSGGRQKPGGDQAAIAAGKRMTKLWANPSGDETARCHLPPLVPCSQSSVTGARACRRPTPADRLAAATPWPPSAPFRRPTVVGVALPSVAAGPRHLGARQTGDSGQMASRRLSDLLALAITPSRTSQDQRRSGP
jgi:hypothetical protein